MVRINESEKHDKFFYRRKLALRIHDEWKDWKKTAMMELSSGQLEDKIVDKIFYVGGVLQGFDAIFCGERQSYIREDNYELVPASEYTCSVFLSCDGNIILKLFSVFYESDISIRAPLRGVIKDAARKFFDTEKNIQKRSSTGLQVTISS